MTAQLNEELQHLIREHGEAPIEVVDPATSRIYVLLAREQYERLRPLFEGEPLTVEEQRTLLRQAGTRAGWDDPEMDAYDNYDEQRRS